MGYLSHVPETRRFQELMQEVAPIILRFHKSLSCVMEWQAL